MTISKTSSLVLMLITFNSLVFSQLLYTPKNIQKAIEKKTRTTSGLPGENYWQNKSIYNIKVNVLTAEKLIKGEETIKYFNNSPDTLSRIVVRLYQNIFRIGNFRDFEIDKRDITDGVKLNKIVINDINYDPDTSKELRNRGTLLYIRPIKKIPPHSSCNLMFTWEFKLPSYTSIRMGAYDSTSFMVAYWYPQIAVYDDIDGWDENSYTGQKEFYNDFNDYNVEITVPNTCSVWATGILKNPEQVLNTKYFNRYKAALNSDTIIKIISPDDLLEMDIHNSSTSTNTWKFEAENVTDFAFATSSHYLWDAVSLTKDKNSNSRILISAAYNPKSKDFYEVADISRKTIEMLSNNFPGIPYPFSSMTVFNGDGGMEYPMMVNDASEDTRAGTTGLTSHEISHSYFPFYMGINETKYAWMDEGWAVMLPFELQMKLEPSNSPIERNVSNYEYFAGEEMELPLMTPSNQMNGNTYRVASYSRSGLAYYFLRDALGKELFDYALREYIKSWNGKHPSPFDFFNSFNHTTKQDLSWFWKPWFFENGYPDLALKIEILGEITNVEIEKVGNIPIPLFLKINFNDRTSQEIFKDASIWKNGNTKIKYDFKFDKKVNTIELGNNRIPDINRANNYYKMK
jgi:hypothetical protein